MHDAFAELADLPQEEFVSARNRLAKRLAAEGRSTEAARLKKLPKPKVPDWIADQVRRQHSDVVQALRDSSESLAATQTATISSGTSDALRAAMATRREALRRVAEVVDDFLAENGRPSHYRSEVLSTIDSAITDKVAAGTFGLPADLAQAPREHEPVRDAVAERRMAHADAAVAAAEARVSRAREALARAESDLATVRERRIELQDDR